MKLLQLRAITFIVLCISLSTRADLTPKNLPPISDYKNRVLLGLEIEVKHEGLAHIIKHFNVPGIDDSLPDDLKATKVLSKLSLLQNMTLKKDGVPAELRSALEKLEWIDGGSCVEFRHKTPTNNPVEYIRTVVVLSQNLGLSEKIKTPLSKHASGPWFSYHTHMSVNEGETNLSEMARSLNVLKAVEYAASGKADYALGGDFSVFTTSISHKGQMRLVEDNRIEMRRQSFDPLNELKRNLFLMTRDPEEAQRLIADELARKLTSQTIRDIVKVPSDLSRTVLTQALHRVAQYSQQSLPPDGLEMIWNFYKNERLPIPLFAYYGSMSPEYRQKMRSRFMDTFTVDDDWFESYSKYLSQSFLDHSPEERRAIHKSLQGRGQSKLATYFVQNVLPKDSALHAEHIAFRSLAKTMPADDTMRINVPPIAASEDLTPPTPPMSMCSRLFSKFQSHLAWHNDAYIFFGKLGLVLAPIGAAVVIVVKEEEEKKERVNFDLTFSEDIILKFPHYVDSVLQELDSREKFFSTSSSGQTYDQKFFTRATTDSGLELSMMIDKKQKKIHVSDVLNLNAERITNYAIDQRWKETVPDGTRMDLQDVSGNIQHLPFNQSVKIEEKNGKISYRLFYKNQAIDFFTSEKENNSVLHIFAVKPWGQVHKYPYYRRPK